jgi:quinol monooxygenase YgiN
MLTITAIIRARPHAKDIVRDALLSVVEAVRETEPQTASYFVTQSAQDHCVFTTFERFADRAAMERHNTSEAVARFIREAGSHFDGDIVVHVGEELACK